LSCLEVEMIAQRLNISTAQLLLNVGFGFGQAEDFAALFPLSPFLEQFDSLEALQNVAFRDDGTGSFKTAMLRHNWKNERQS